MNTIVYILFGLTVIALAVWTLKSDVFNDAEDASEIKIAYLCDKKFCEECNNPDCLHTFDIAHAINFECVEPGKYMEKEDS